MADRLSDYRAKRDFARTPEPADQPARRQPGGARAPRFVVQEHHARRLHWDLRLECDGALASWAVPNGIPDDPKRNRKAVRTEDHPLEYLEFQGDIPRGKYGAGRMTVWDSGTYEAEKFRDDEVIATFHGERLRGRYALFQTDGRDWMIHRMDPPDDPEAEPMPERLVPMLARLGELPADERGWAFEVKWDGIRAVTYWEPGRLRIESRNLNDVTSQYPELRAVGRELGSRRAALDGEIVALDEGGRPSFERLQQRMHLASDSAVRRRMRDFPVFYMIFDLLYLDGRSLMDLPYLERRERLAALALQGPHWSTPSHRVGDGAAMLDASREQGLEGLVAKRCDSRYEPGRRSAAWVKVKHTARQELVIGGWVPGQGRRSRRIGALLVGYHEIAGGGAADDGDAPLVYAGRVGTGFTESELDRLQGELGPLRRDASPFARRAARRGAGPPRGSVWVAPERVAEVEFRAWTAEGMLRAPSYKGLRADRDARSVVCEDLVGAVEAAAAPTTPRTLRRVRGGEEVEVQSRKLKLSNLDKVLYPATGFTKGDLIGYYRRVADALIPHLHGRPLTLKRYPDGVEGQFFYEKQCPSHRPDWVRTEAIWSRHTQRDINFCLADDLPTLVWLGNLADLELHTSLALAKRIERPTMLVFDLDPGAPADVLDCAQVALWLRDLFDQLGLRCLVKTSGSKGLQAYVPLNTETSYEQTKPFAKAVAELLAKQHPDRVVSVMAKERRGGKVFVDWSQNDEHKTTVCVYSLRARERPTVSTPVTWDEVERALEAGEASQLVFECGQALDRVADRGDLFAPVLSEVQELPPLEPESNAPVSGSDACNESRQEEIQMAEATAADLKLIQYLNEAYGTEKQLETALQAHITMATRATYKKRLQQHLRETKRHAKDVERRIKKLGGKAEASPLPGAVPEAAADAASAVTAAVGKVAAAVQGPLHAVRGTGPEEKQLKNAKTEYASEAQEIATYTAIQTLADTVGDKDTSKLAKAILREEQRMASFLEKLIPQLTKSVATAEIPASERNGGRRRSSASRRRSSSRSSGSSSSRSRSSSASSRSGSGSRASSRSGGSRSGGSTRSKSSRSGSGGRSRASSRRSSGSSS